MADPQGDVNRILKNIETVTARFAKKESLLEMAVGDRKASNRSRNSEKPGYHGPMDGILKRIDALAGKTDEEIYGREGVLPLVRNILRDLLTKLTKIEVTSGQHQQGKRRSRRFDERSDGPPERPG